MVDIGERPGPQADRAATLRAMAERRLPETAAAPPAGPADELKLLHELQVHHVELQLQKEELEQARAEAVAARDRYARLFDLSPVGVLEVALDGSILEANQAAARMLLGSKSELPGTRLDWRLALASVPAWRALLTATVQAGHGWAELQLARPDAPVMVVQAESAFDAAVGSMLVTLADISEHVRAQSAQREAALALERANRAKNEFLSRMSHELRTPLNALLGFAQLLLAERAQPLAPAQRGRVEHIERAGQQLLALIEQSMDIARIEAGRIDIRLQPLSAQALFAECLPMVAPQAEAAGVVLAPPRLEPGDCWLRADANRLRQVLLNLLSNAVKYNRPGGEVGLTCHCGPGSESVTLVVADNGPGMSAEQQQGLFKPFDRLGAERTGVEGSGLGLVITRQLVDAMGGTLWVDSVSGQGTTLSVTLPRIPAPAAGPAATSDPASPAGTAAGAHANRRVLFIGHAQDDRDLIEAAVRALPNVSLTASHDGRSGIRTARILRADLVIIGLDPSDMTGADVLRALRAQSQTRDVRCVALSADPPAAAASDLRAAGFQEFWPKPLGHDYLRSRLLALLA